MPRPTVAIVQCPQYEQVDEALGGLLEMLGGLGKYIQPGQKVLLKPNLLAASAVETAVTTHPAVVHAVVRRVQELGAVPFIGDSPAFGATPKVAKVTGMMAVAEELGIEVVELDQPAWVPSSEAESMSRFRISRRVLDADAVINLPKLKVHQQMQMTGAIKNLFGCVAGKRKAWLHLSHGEDRMRFGKMLLETAQRIRPVLTITDAVIAMERQGPRHGDAYPLGLLTGGTDVVALDSIHWSVLGQPIEEFDLLRAARELGMGAVAPEEVEVLGVPLQQARAHDFQMARQVPVSFSPFRIARSTIKHLWAKRAAAI